MAGEEQRPAIDGAALFDAAPDPLLLLAPDGRIAMLNRAAAALPGAAAGALAELLFAPAERSRWREHHDRVSVGAEAVGEFELVDERRLEVCSTPLACGYLAALRDVTERHRADARLRASDVLLTAFMTHAPIGMYLKDEAGRYVMLNPEMEKVFRRPNSETIGRSPADLLGPEEAALIAGFDREILASGKARAVEEHLPGLDEYGWSLVVRFPVSLDGGPPRQIGGFDIDITDRKRAEERLRRSEKRAALVSLFAGLSHELNNPLAILLSLSTLMEVDAAGTPFAVRAAKLHAAAQRCAAIVESFLALSRPAAPASQSLDVNALVRDIAARAAPEAGAASVALDLAPALPPVPADPDQLGQALTALIRNARTALTAVPAPDRRLGIATRIAGDEIAISVIDNGPGVPEALRARIFEPFFTTQPTGATGLGLSLALALAEAQGGTLDYCDAAGGGACFTIRLPRDPEGE